MSGRAIAGRILIAGALLGAGVATPVHAQKEVNGFIGGEPGTAVGRFLQPTDVAVFRGDSGDPADDKILVTEGLARTSRVQRLDGDGNFELAWGEDGEVTEPSGVAVNPTTGDVYVADAGDGAAGRVQRFTIGGGLIDGWSLDVGGSAAGPSHRPIAIAPSEPHDVFVGDGANDRVLQFSADGEFLRAWGWGVVTGERRFEVCDESDTCRTGLPVPGFGRRERSWPRHLAVDSDGVVYASLFLGMIFESNEVRARIVRFRSDSPPDPPAASDALLRPLRTDQSFWSEAPESSLLTNGATLGLDLDPDNGRLLAINNPFGVSNMDEIANPGATGGEYPRVHVEDQFPFLQNVTGIAAGGGDVVFLSSGVVKQLTGTSSFTGCVREDAKRDCHGLIVLAPGGPPQAVLAPAPDPGGLAALVDANGTARYRFQTSTDGRTWTDLGRPRYVTGTAFEELQVPAGDLTPGVLHRLRLVVTKRAYDEIETTVSGQGVLLAPPRGDAESASAHRLAPAG